MSLRGAAAGFFFAGCITQAQTIPLAVPAGATLRLYLTHKTPKTLDAPVEAKLLEPVYAFDHVVIPAGVVVRGWVSQIQPMTKWQRTREILGGDFTPLRQARVQFDTVVMPDGHEIAIHTKGATGLYSLAMLAPPKAPKKQKAQNSTPTGVLGTGKQKAETQIRTAINDRRQTLEGIVRSPNKKELLEDFLWAKLPYHPQSVRTGTRFDAELLEPIAFGAEVVKSEDLAQLGTQPPADSIVRARLLTALDSATSKKGEQVEAVIAEPLYGPDHKLVLPEGTRLTGEVVLARRARWLHRGGQLRFTFQKVDLPAATAAGENPELHTQAILGDAESAAKTPVKVDSEGGVKAKESKTRLIAPIVSALIANKSMDNDAGKHTAAGTSEGNVGGRTLGGLSGFGLAGSLASQGSKYIGTAFGLYGMGWSVYSKVLSRGGEVEFGKNALIEIKFGGRPPAGTPFQAE